jgi:hypothetical protein
VPAPSSGSVTATFTQLGASSAQTRPVAPSIEKLRLGTHKATFTFSKPARGVELQCALVRRITGKHAKQPKPSYGSCGVSKTYRHLGAGSFTLYLRAYANGATSPISKRSFVVR